MLKSCFIKSVMHKSQGGGNNSTSTDQWTQSAGRDLTAFSSRDMKSLWRTKETLTTDTVKRLKATNTHTQSMLLTVLRETALLLHRRAGSDFLFTYLARRCSVFQSQAGRPAPEAALFIKMILTLRVQAAHTRSRSSNCVGTTQSVWAQGRFALLTRG